MYSYVFVYVNPIYSNKKKCHPLHNHPNKPTQNVFNSIFEDEKKIRSIAENILDIVIYYICV